jgi:putative transport protein
VIFISLLLIFISIFCGLILGNVKFYNFKFGVSGTIFTSLIISWISEKFLNAPIDSLKNEFDVYFNFSLILFISSVGLIASKKFKGIFKEHGFKFAFLGFFTTFTGFITTYLFSLFRIISKEKIIGLFSGSLTSSPGLATALENSSTDAEIVYGYSIGYIPGVFGVIFFLSLITQILNIYKDNNPELKKNDIEGSGLIKFKNFNFLSFSIIIIFGIILGKIKINFGLINFSFGITGGILISSLLLGSIKKIWIFSFHFDDNILKGFQNLGLLIFLASIGLKSGYYIIESLSFTSFYLMILSLLIALISLSIAFIVGKHILKIDDLLLIGAITGGMTSTPGLATAIDLTNSDKVIVGYGASYPFALLGMIIFNKILLYILT